MILLSLKNIVRKKSRAFLIFILSIVAAFNIFTQVAQKNSVQNSLKQLISEAISGQYILYDSSKQINVLESQFSDINLFNWNVTKTDLLLKRVPHIKHISPRLRFGGMLSHHQESIGINFQALSREHLKRVSSILEFQKDHSPNMSDGIVISKTFADELESKVGDTLVVLANNKDGFLSDNLLIISGIFKTNGPAQFLLPIGYMPYEKGIEIMGLEENETMELLINFHDLHDSQDKAQLLETEIAAINKKLKIATWKESSPLLNSIASLWVNIGYIIKLIFIVFSVLILINIIMMMTNNRKKEIGTLLAFGFRPFAIINSIAFEYIFLAVIGVSLIGGLLKIVFDLFFQNGIPIPWEELQAAYLSAYITPEIYWSDILLVGFFFGLACYLAVLISLRKLPKSEITDLLRTTT